MNNIKSLEDFLNQSAGLDILSSTDQLQSITPLASIQHPQTPQLATTKIGLDDTNHDNGNKKTSENNMMLKSKTENHNSASDVEVDTNYSQIEELRKFVTKSLQDIKAINKKVSSQQNQRLNNLEEKVKNKNKDLQSVTNNELSELKMKLAQTNKNKTQSNQISPVEIASLKSDLLSIFSKVLSDTVESTQLMFAEQSKELNKLKEKLADRNNPTHNGKINSNNKNTDILNVFWKALQELKEFNETEFANFNNRLFIQNTQIQTQATEIQHMSMQLEKEKKKRVTLTERFDKLLKAFNLLKKSTFDEVPIKNNMIIDNEELRRTSISTSTISLMDSFDSNNPKSEHGNNEKIKKEEKLKKEISATSKKKDSVSSNNQNEMLSSSRSTPSDIFNKFSQVIGTFPPAPGTFSTAPGMFPTAPSKFPTAPGMFPTAPGMFPTAPGMFPMAPGIFPTAPGIFYPPPGSWYTAPGPFSRAPGPYPIAPSSFTTNHTIFPTVPAIFSKVPGTFLKAPVIFPTAPGTLSKVSTRLSTDPGTISNAPGIFPTPPVTFSKDPGSFSEAPSKLLPSSDTLSKTSEVICSSQPDISLSRSCSETSLDSNDSNNDQFLSYLDKAQLYLKQMTSGIMNNPLNEGDSKQEDLLLYEEGSESEEKKEEEKEKEEEDDEKGDDLSKIESQLETSTQLEEVVTQEDKVECPLCNQIFNQSNINDHAFICQGPVLTRNRKQKLSVRTTPSIDKDKLSVGLRLRLKLQRESGEKQKHHRSKVFFTGIPGYKVQIVAMHKLSKSVVYFFVRVFEGEHDSDLSWPFNQRFCIKVASKTKSTKQVEWYIPPLHRKWKNKIDRQFQSEKVTETFGGYDMKELTDLDEVFLDVYLV